MKKLLLQFVEIFKHFFKSSKKDPKAVEHTYQPPIAEPIRYAQRMVPKHNNRHVTRGRKVQYVDMGGYFRPIFHSNPR